MTTENLTSLEIKLLTVNSDKRIKAMLKSLNSNDESERKKALRFLQNKEVNEHSQLSPLERKEILLNVQNIDQLLTDLSSHNESDLYKDLAIVSSTRELLKDYSPVIYKESIERLVEKKGIFEEFIKDLSEQQNQVLNDRESLFVETVVRSSEIGENFSKIGGKTREAVNRFGMFFTNAEVSGTSEIVGQREVIKNNIKSGKFKELADNLTSPSFDHLTIKAANFELNKKDLKTLKKTQKLIHKKFDSMKVQNPNNKSAINQFFIDAEKQIEGKKEKAAKIKTFKKENNIKTGFRKKISSIFKKKAEQANKTLSVGKNNNKNTQHSIH